MSFYYRGDERCRILHPAIGEFGDKYNGFFIFPDAPHNQPLFTQASNGQGWEHVSVSTKGGRLPNWIEMCYVKELFWAEEDCAVQYHVPKSQHRDSYPALHLWRPNGVELPMPDPDMVALSQQVTTATR